MEEVFITKIHIDQVRHLRDITIELDSKERKHLIITGKNGSGKTSFLEGVSQSLLKYTSLGDYNKSELAKIAFFNNNLKKIPSDSKKSSLSFIFGGVFLRFNSDNPDLMGNLNQKGNFILKYFPAKRSSLVEEPKGITKLNFESNYNINVAINHNFLQFIVNLKAETAFAKDDGEKEAANKIDQWFNNFENSLQELFDEPGLKLIFDRKEYNFYFQFGNGNKVTINQLSDGYVAILGILSELILRMEKQRRSDVYDVQGVVLIDEIETHLHIDLQKKILPFLTTFFPKIQFIVTTHSPFVISSDENSVVFDLEKQIRIEDATGYSYDTLIESYFGSDKYSIKVKREVERLEELSFKNDLSIEESMELRRLEHFFDTIPLAYAPELEVKLQQIKLKKLIPQPNGQRN